MPIKIICGDITKMNVDAIVNSANRSLMRGGGVDGKIHRAAGPELEAECKTLGSCHFGEARITAAYRLQSKYVIHAVGPRWLGGRHDEEQQLTSCYKNSMKLAKDYGCKTVAFPLISSGIYRYPKDQALNIALNTIRRFLPENDMTVYIVLYDNESCQIASELFPELITEDVPC